MVSHLLTKQTFRDTIWYTSRKHMLRIGEVKTAQGTYDLKGVNCGWKNKY